MSSEKLQQDSNSSSNDLVMMVASLAILLVGIVAYHYFSDLPSVVRVLMVLVAAGASTFVFYQSAKGRLIAHYLKDTQTEVKKVVWPTRKETLQSTLTVFVAVILIGVYLWLADMFFAWAVAALTGR